MTVGRPEKVVVCHGSTCTTKAYLHSIIERDRAWRRERGQRTRAWRAATGCARRLLGRRKLHFRRFPAPTLDKGSPTWEKC